MVTRYRAVLAVLAVLAGESVTVVAADMGVSRQTVHAWLGRYRAEGLGGLIDRAHGPSGVRISRGPRLSRSCARCGGSIPGAVLDAWGCAAPGRKPGQPQRPVYGHPSARFLG
jgi:hypothetical protein